MSTVHSQISGANIVQNTSIMNPADISNISGAPRPPSASTNTNAQSRPASQPQQASAQTGQQSVTQLSAGGAAPPAPTEEDPLTRQEVEEAKTAERNRLLGERLFAKIKVVEPKLAGKITGMFLEMSNTEIFELLSEQRALMNKINEALAVLKDDPQKSQSQHEQNTSNNNEEDP